MSHIKTTENSLQEKLNKLADEKFSEKASTEFFGNLNILEIEKLTNMIEDNEIELPDPKTKDFLLIYLKRLKEEIFLKQK